MKSFLKNFDKYSDKQLILLSVSFGIIGFILVATTFFKPEYYSMGIGLGAIFIIVAIYFLIIVAIRDKTSDKNADIKSEKPNIQNTHQRNNKLTICKTCGKEIAKTAQNCPHCGARRGLSIADQSCMGVIAANLIIGAIILFIIIYFVNRL